MDVSQKKGGGGKVRFEKESLKRWATGLLRGFLVDESCGFITDFYCFLSLQGRLEEKK